MVRDTAALLRRGILLLLVLGLTGVTVELVLLNHFEDVWQILPFISIGFAFATMGWLVMSCSPTSVRAMRIAMVLLIVVGLTGFVLHYLANREFQLDMDPSQSAWSLFSKAMHAQAPPALAPGVMAQLGLLGLLCTWRHPAPRRCSGQAAQASQEIQGDRT